jgi:ATP-dependent helicase HrpB
MLPLPIDNIIPELRSALTVYPNVVLSANPGAGKTTRVPIALMNESWLQGKKIMMLEPRRLAAIRSAEYMSQQQNEMVGGTIGYRIRGDSKISKQTKIEVITEGILTRILQEDPSLPDTGLIIFDEFHERSIHADIGLAFTIDVQKHLRNDLRILVMSATLNNLAVSTLLYDAPVIKSEGKVFPVNTKYLPHHHTGYLEPLVVSTIMTALRETEGDVLVFLPGQREIRRVESLLLNKELPPQVEIHLLFGDAPSQQQRAALQRTRSGKRKVILSTNIAETSLTVEGVTVVIDSGLVRNSVFDSRRGMSGLVTQPVSQASAEQRRGRAGRVKPGFCYRLWTPAEHSQLPQYSQPEILVTDLSAFALEIAQWGDPNAERLQFLDRPPIKHLHQAQLLLKQLGAIDVQGMLTEYGKMMSRMGIHPRLSHMLIRGKEMRIGSLACDVAALLEEGDVLKGKNDSDIDLRSRYEAVRDGRIEDTFSLQRIYEQSRRLHALLGEKNHQPFSIKNAHDYLGVLLALAYPERVGKRREKGEKYQLSGNTIGVLPKGSLLSREEFLVAADVDGAGSEVKIFLAEPIAKESIVEVFKNQIQSMDEIYWDEKLEGIAAKTVSKYGAIELSEQAFEPPEEKSQQIICNVIRSTGLRLLPWDKESESFRKRSEWLRLKFLVNKQWVNVSDEHLLQTLEEWLNPFLKGIKKKSQFSQLNLLLILRSLFTYEQLRELDTLAPTHLTVPSGSTIPIDYSGEQPILAVRLQEMFGETKTPTVVNGKVKVVLHLLSPARRPLAVTQDLPSFWKNVYPEVRKDMRGQYPKHYWPENPLEAEPTRKTKKQMKFS